MSKPITTDEVRAAYRDLMWEYTNTTLEAEEAKFDAWLAQHDAEVTAQAGARIIKLLEEHTLPKCDSNECNCWDVTGLEAAIALIKGEN